MQYQCSCQCQQSRVAVSAKPLMRFICHCHICQQVYQDNYADILLYLPSAIEQLDKQNINFSKYTKLFPVNRGVCTDCQQPVVGYFSLAGYPLMAFVPTNNHPEPETLPQVSFHSFYHRRTQDIEGHISKYSGYIPSQWAVISRFVHRLIVNKG